MDDPTDCASLRPLTSPPFHSRSTAALTTITDRDDPRIEPYRLVRERDLAGRHQRFVAEGEVVLKVLLTRSRFRVESLLLAENRVASLAPVIPAVPATVPIYVAGRAVMEAIVGFPIHRGILALGRRGPTPTAEGLLSALPERALVVGLVGLANHDNVGGIFRNATAFGADAVLLDEPQTRLVDRQEPLHFVLGDAPFELHAPHRDRRLGLAVHVPHLLPTSGTPTTPPILGP